MNHAPQARNRNNLSRSRILALLLVPVLLLLTLVILSTGEPAVVAAADPATATATGTPRVSVALPASSMERAPATSTQAPVASGGSPTAAVTATTVPKPPVTAMPVPRAATQTPLVTAKPTTPLTTQTPSPAPLARLVIPSIGVDAAIEVKGLNAEGVMDAPSGPAIVTWYDFSAQPVAAGNAVFAGHLDYAGYGPAVFWRLGELRSGDVIEVVHEDGVIVRYSVTGVQPFQATEDATSIVASSGAPAITIITCEGTFDQVNRVYHERLVVTGVRIG